MSFWFAFSSGFVAGPLVCGLIFYLYMLRMKKFLLRQLHENPHKFQNQIQGFQNLIEKSKEEL